MNNSTRKLSYNYFVQSTLSPLNTSTNFCTNLGGMEETSVLNKNNEFNDLNGFFYHTSLQ